jgi:hypothetical protein
MRPLSSPLDRWRAARRRHTEIAITIAAGIGLTLFPIALLVGAEAQEGGSGGPGLDRGVWAAALVLLLVWLLVVLRVLAARRQRDRWASAVSRSPLARVPATVARRHADKTGAYLDLRMPDGEEWVVLYERGGWWPVRRGDAIVLEIYPSDDDGCVGAFQVRRSGQVCPFSADRLPHRVAVTHVAEAVAPVYGGRP